MADENTTGAFALGLAVAALAYLVLRKEFYHHGATSNNGSISAGRSATSSDTGSCARIQETSSGGATITAKTPLALGADSLGEVSYPSSTVVPQIFHTDIGMLVRKVI